MVKLKGPAVSTEAFGSLANAVTFQQGKRGGTMKKHAKPKQPRTGKQIGLRASMKWLTQQWSTLTADEMATWFNRAMDTKIANYHAYLSYNAKRFHNFRMPSKEDPATEAGGGGGMEDCFAIAEYKAVRYHAKSSGPPVSWGYILCRSQTGGFTPGPENTIALFFREPTAYTVYWDRGLVAGTYFYRAAGFDDTGRIVPFFPDFEVTVL